MIFHSFISNEGLMLHEAAIFQMEVPPDRHSKPLLPAPTMAENHKVAAVNGGELPPSKIRGEIKAPVKKAVDSDETDCSTSFADTTSLNEDNSAALSDAEVESQLYGDSNGFSSPFYDFNTAFAVRKKRVTNHWRNFIRPLMWRCKWAELKIRQFELQALKYAKHIAEHDRTKHLGSDKSIPEGCTSRSMPFDCQRPRIKLTKRRKRVRVEDETDTKLYMSQHSLFSYHETKKSDPDGISMTDDFDDPVSAEQNAASQEELGLGVPNWSFFDEKDNDTEHILQKIDVARSRVQKLKAQLDLVISKNAGKFSSSENLSHLAPFEAQTSSVRSPNFSTCNGDAMSAGGFNASTQHISEFDIGDLAMPEHAVSSYGEGFHIPDIIESTVGLLSSVDVTQHQSQIGDSGENIVDNMLIHNQPAEVERHTFGSSQHLAIAKQEVVKSEQEESTHPAMESDTATKDAIPQEQSTLKSCLGSDFQIPKNKRKRGERKAGTGNWSRQCPGEPDSP